MSPSRLVATALLLSAVAAAQEAPSVPAGGGEVALAPSRLEIPIAPGQSRTEVVNVISSGSGNTRVRLLASLGDWALDRSGEIKFSRPGTAKRSATEWMTYSPVEFQVGAGEVHPIRVTVDVPPGTPPGDYTAVMFVEERPPDLKAQGNRKQLRFHFRLAAIFYIQVGQLTKKGSLEALEVDTTVSPLVVVPTLKNSGNSHLRPLHSFEILDVGGKRVASVAESSPGPVLAESEFLPKVKADTALPPGSYTLKYRVDFRDGGKVVEGRKAFTIGGAAAPAAGATKPDAGVKR